VRSDKVEDDLRGFALQILIVKAITSEFRVTLKSQQNPLQVCLALAPCSRKQLRWYLGQRITVKTGA